MTATGAAVATAPAPAADAPLQSDLLPLLLAALEGDVSALCASACVCTHWRDALLRSAGAAALWRTLRVTTPAKWRLTDARLGALLARAAGGLVSLDVSGCGQLSDDGLAAALKR